MNERFISVFEEVLAANKSGEVRDLLIIDRYRSEFLHDAVYTLRCFAKDKGFNLIDIDAVRDNWLPEIRARELFHKLSVSDTVLLVRNYATKNWSRRDETDPRNFLRDVALNRNYGFGNDYVPSDELPNLLFVVALNDFSEIYLDEEELSRFTIVHKDESKNMWMNTHISHPATKMHPVMSRENKDLYRASADGTDICLDVRKAFLGLPRRPLRRNSFYDEIMRKREERIHLYLEKNRPDFCEQVENLILKGRFSRKEDTYKLDAARLIAVFPNLKTVCCHDNIVIENTTPELRVLDPFEVGEYSFELAKTGNIKEANRYLRILPVLNCKCARFWKEVAKDYNRTSEDHPEFDPNGTIVHDGMDDLFRIYLLGWYTGDCFFEEEHKMFLKKHKNFKKAIKLLPVRFKDCDQHEVGEKLFWDLQHVEKDEKPDYEGLVKVILATEKIIPDVRKSFFEAVELYGCEECSSSLILKQLLEGSNTKD